MEELKRQREVQERANETITAQLEQLVLTAPRSEVPSPPPDIPPAAPESASPSREPRLPPPPGTFLRPAAVSKEPETILPASCLTTTLTWEVEATVRRLQATQPDPGGGPPGRMFVPDQARAAVLAWGHDSNLACHPGARRTLEFIRRQFWWPAMGKDVRAIPLPKLPSAKETAVLMLEHVFRTHGLPTDLVSDRGPQFTSGFWRAFCTLIGATGSPSATDD
ncbi:hypothetical protein DPEC_G00276540 [Dallia pectoralis]|uniref:Uncharacterized protein n=1 Tax=Dallia pectoralis TaxID=75939 RepID=A0ACC2FLN4_DALPE|nr:hypothetical protein DPEC_G00276540 [Dallia pectoralis]